MGHSAKRAVQSAEGMADRVRPFAMPDWSIIHQERRFGRWSLPLAFFSLLYGVGVRFRLKAYEKGIFRGKSLPGFVLSVGNITAGGTGKTPAVAMLAQWAVGEGHRVAILSKGYGGRYKQKVLEVSDGKHIYADSQVAGDEPFLLARGVSGSPVVISKNRYLAGMYAYKKFGSDFFILDDGFQHLGLKRNLNLVLIDASEPFGNARLLPWGPLREPLSQLGRADAFILTRFSRSQSAERTPVEHPKWDPSSTGQGGQSAESGRQEAGSGEQGGQRTLAFLKERFPLTPVFCADHVADKLVFPLSGLVHDAGFLKKKRVVGFAGIAHPEYFEETLNGLGADVVRFRGFRDHYLFNGKDLDELIRVKEKTGAQYIVTTEKDWMRIASVSPVYADLAYLSIRFVLQEPDGLLRMIRDGLKDK